MYRSFFPRDLFAELDRLQREVQQGLDLSPTIRGVDRGVLSIAGERRSALPSADASGASGGARDGKSSVHIAERFHGRFQRVITLPEDADPEQVEARYGDGVLRISVARRAAAQPRRIAVQ